MSASSCQIRFQMFNDDIYISLLQLLHGLTGWDGAGVVRTGRRWWPSPGTPCHSITGTNSNPMDRYLKRYGSIFTTLNLYIKRKSRYNRSVLRVNESYVLHKRLYTISRNQTAHFTVYGSILSITDMTFRNIHAGSNFDLFLKSYDSQNLVSALDFLSGKHKN